MWLNKTHAKYFTNGALKTITNTAKKEHTFYAILKYEFLHWFFGKISEGLLMLIDFRIAT